MENTRPGTVESAVLIALSRLSEEERNTKVEGGDHERMVVELKSIFRTGFAPLRSSSPVGVLSPRELETLRFLASGLTNREIAILLGISVKTIDTHRGHVLKKLRLRNNADLTRFAFEHGLISL